MILINRIFLLFLNLDLLQGVGKDAIDVLRMIKRRLQAEVKTVGRNDLKLLSKLLQEDDLEVRTKFYHFFTACYTIEMCLLLFDY